MIAESGAPVSDEGSAAPDVRHALLGLSIESLVAGSDASRRVLQAVHDTIAHGALPFSTVAEYLAAGRRAVPALAACSPHFGRKAALELDALVREHARKAAMHEAIHRERLASLLCDTPIGLFFAGAALPVRLARVLASPTYGTLPFRAYVLEHAAIERSMEAGGNCGRRSLTLLRALATEAVNDQLGRAGFPDAQRSAALATLFEGSRIHGPAASGASTATMPDAPPEDCSLADFVGWLLGTLPPRAAQVLSRRFGIDGRAPETLADIGQDLGVTRERIRQIEAKGLRALRDLCQRYPPTVLLNEAAGAGWRTLAGERWYLTDAEAQAALRVLDGGLLLILEAAGIPAADWLARIASSLGTGWMAPDRDQGRILAVAESLAGDSRSDLLPRALSEFGAGAGHADADVEAAAVVLLGLHVEAGYMFAKRPLARLRRAAGLHALLVRRARATPLLKLLSAYRAAVPDDPCSYRDALVVMEAASHLFIEVADDVWVALGPGGSLPTGGRAATDRAREQDDEHTVIGALERELARTGPTRLGTLLERSVDVLPTGRSTHSIGPTLLTNRGRFARPLPGVYALPDQVLSTAETLHAEHIDYLLEPHQARLYALGRRAGEPWGSFPLWTPAAEYRLCRWARANAKPELFRTLLAVASPDAWPVDETEKAAWRELAAQQGRFELAFATRVTVPVLPPLDRVLAACLHLVEAGQIGWMTCNRILGLRLDSQTSTSLLSVVVGSRIVEEPAGWIAWQRPHRAGPALAAWTERLSRELGQEGSLRWAGPAGSDLAAEIGWSVDAGEAPDISIGAFDDELSEFEQLVAEHRRAVRSKRREEALEWLGVE